MTNSMAPSAIAGLGITEMSRRPTHSVRELAVEALRRAVDDAGLVKEDIDGLLIDASPAVWSDAEVLGLNLQADAGLRNLRLLNHMDSLGTTAIQMVQMATFAINARMASAVACVFADTPIIGGQSSGAVFGQTRSLRGIDGLMPASGMFGPMAAYALATRRHMHLFGTTSDHLGAIAVSNRKWATLNPAAILREPITLEDYHNSRWIVEPLHLLDCAIPANGGIAVIVTSSERARDLRPPPAYVIGMSQGHPGTPNRAGFELDLTAGASLSKEPAFRMAGVTIDDIDICEFYDTCTFATLATLEGYGFCGKGEGGPYVADGKLEPGGSLPTNTSGGLLSGSYMQGMTPLAEAVIQARGQAGERQVAKNDVILVTGRGGVLQDLHACLIVSPHPASR